MSNINPVIVKMSTHIWYELCFLRNMFTVLISKVPEYKGIITPEDVEMCRNSASEAVTQAMEDFHNELIAEANKPTNVSVEWDRPDAP